MQNAVDLFDAEVRLAESDHRPQLMPAFAQGIVSPGPLLAGMDTPVATENRIRDGADAGMGYPRFVMLDLLKLLSGLLVGLFRSHAAREAETAFLRQQLSS